MGTINVISGIFAIKGERNEAWEVYITLLSMTIQLGKRSRTTKDNVIIFFKEDITHVTTPYVDDLVVTAEIDGFDTKKSLVDGGSSTNILFLDIFKNMVRNRKELKKVDFPLIEFAISAIYPLRVIPHQVVLGVGWKILMIDIIFIVVEAPASYETIIGQTAINPNKIIPSTVHQKMISSLLMELKKSWAIN